MPDASGPAQSDQFAQMVDDRASEGQFRIDRRMYDDEAVFEAEMERIFEATQRKKSGALHGKRGCGKT